MRGRLKIQEGKMSDYKLGLDPVIIYALTHTDFFELLQKLWVSAKQTRTVLPVVNERSCPCDPSHVKDTLKKSNWNYCTGIEERGYGENNPNLNKQKTTRWDTNCCGKINSFQNVFNIENKCSKSSINNIYPAVQTQASNLLYKILFIMSIMQMQWTLLSST